MGVGEAGLTFGFVRKLRLRLHLFLRTVGRLLCRHNDLQVSSMFVVELYAVVIVGDTPSISVA